LSFLDTKRLVLAEIPAMSLAPIEELPTLYAALLRKIATFVILIRPGRSYPSSPLKNYVWQSHFRTTV